MPDFAFISVLRIKDNGNRNRQGKCSNKIRETHSFGRSVSNHGAIFLHSFLYNCLDACVEMQSLCLSVQRNHPLIHERLFLRRFLHRGCPPPLDRPSSLVSQDRVNINSVLYVGCFQFMMTIAGLRYGSSRCSSVAHRRDVVKRCQWTTVHLHLLTASPPPIMQTVSLLPLWHECVRKGVILSMLKYFIPFMVTQKRYHNTFIKWCKSPGNGWSMKGLVYIKVSGHPTV